MIVFPKICNLLCHQVCVWNIVPRRRKSQWKGKGEDTLAGEIQLWNQSLLYKRRIWWIFRKSLSLTETPPFLWQHEHHRRSYLSNGLKMSCKFDPLQRLSLILIRISMVTDWRLPKFVIKQLPGLFGRNSCRKYFLSNRRATFPIIISFILTAAVSQPDGREQGSRVPNK